MRDLVILLGSSLGRNVFIFLLRNMGFRWQKKPAQMGGFWNGRASNHL
jgi:hypothetical protein